MTTQDKLIKNKLGLIELATYLNNVSEACRTLGYSRDTLLSGQERLRRGRVGGAQGKIPQKTQL